MLYSFLKHRIIDIWNSLNDNIAACDSQVTLELLKFPEVPISRVLHKLFAAVWSSAR